MADYQFNTNLGPTAQQGTNIADMVNLARGVQAYQQAQELNPLAVQKAKMEIEQAQKLNPLAVQREQEAVSQAQIGTKQKGLELNEKQTGILYGLAGGVINDPRMKSGKKDEVMSALQEAKGRATTYGLPVEVVDGVFNPLFEGANKNPGKMTDVLKNIIQTGIGATGQQGLQTPQLATVGGAPATFVSGTGTASPLNIGGQSQGQPNAPMDTGVKPQGVTQTQMQFSYPVRRAGDIRPYAPNEKEEEAAGFDYRNSLAKTATTMSTSLRNIDEVIKEAEKVGKEEWNKGAGILGSAGRNISTFLGTEQGVRYKTLSKDLANLQLSMGADKTTDAGKNLVAAASGEITLPPDILIDIAKRAKADKQNISMQAQGAQAFARKYGDNNMKTFQDMWATNSKDSRVLEAIAINDSNLPKEEKIRQIDKLFANESPASIKRLIQQKNNLIQLSTTGELR